MNKQITKNIDDALIDCQFMPLAEQLRTHANNKNKTVAWDNQARILMEWAADVIDAANEAISNKTL